MSDLPKRAAEALALWTTYQLPPLWEGIDATIRECLAAFAQAGKPVAWVSPDWKLRVKAEDKGFWPDATIPLYTAPLPADKNAILDQARQACLRIGDHGAAVGLCADAIEALKSE
jgi:hypothetical protein